MLSREAGDDNILICSCGGSVDKTDQKIIGSWLLKETGKVLLGKKTKYKLQSFFATFLMGKQIFPKWCFQVLLL